MQGGRKETMLYEEKENRGPSSQPQGWGKGEGTAPFHTVHAKASESLRDRTIGLSPALRTLTLLHFALSCQGPPSLSSLELSASSLPSAGLRSPHPDTGHWRRHHPSSTNTLSLAAPKLSPWSLCFMVLRPWEAQSSPRVARESWGWRSSHCRA